jgi:hypothetical protein
MWAELISTTESGMRTMAYMRRSGNKNARAGNTFPGE